MGNATEPERLKAWERAFKEQLTKHPDPGQFQEGIIKILLDLLQPPETVPKAVERQERGRERRFLLPAIFGDVPRVRILEALIARPDGWFNLADLAAFTRAGKATAKRVIDDMIASGSGLIEERPREMQSGERLVRLADTPVARELRFLHVKLRGIC